MAAGKTNGVKADYTGIRFGSVVSLGRSKKRDRSNSLAYERVRCDCGKVKFIWIYDLTSGRTKSCGCKRAEFCRSAKITHGHGSGSPTYRTFRAALDRCSNPKNARWARYGGRGIRVCARWRRSFASFLEDMGERPGPGYELDRINNDGHYSPSNCRWVPKRTNLNNTSRSRRLRALGLSMTLAQWSRHTGINTETIRKRIDRGWSIHDAVTRDATLVGDLSAIRAALSTIDESNISSLRRAIAEVRRIVDARLNDADLALGMLA